MFLNYCCKNLFNLLPADKQFERGTACPKCFLARSTCLRSIFAFKYCIRVLRLWIELTYLIAKSVSIWDLLCWSSLYVPLFQSIQSCLWNFLLCCSYSSQWCLIIHNGYCKPYIPVHTMQRVWRSLCNNRKTAKARPHEQCNTGWNRETFLESYQSSYAWRT